MYTFTNRSLNFKLHDLEKFKNSTRRLIFLISDRLISISVLKFPFKAICMLSYEAIDHRK